METAEPRTTPSLERSLEPRIDIELNTSKTSYIIIVVSNEK